MVYVVLQVHGMTMRILMITSTIVHNYLRYVQYVYSVLYLHRNYCTYVLTNFPLF